MTTTATKPKSDMLTIKEFFGTREGETLQDFAKEIRALSDQDKAQLAEGIRNETFTY